MRVAALHAIGDPLVIEERDVPVPGLGEVVVRVEACGLCHTDVHVARGDWPSKPPLPLVPGHEIVGKVVEVPWGVDPLDAACLSCAGLSAYRACRSAGVGPARTAAIFGVGGLGHLALQYASIAGASVIAVDIVDAKLTMAANLGAAHVVDASLHDPVEAVHRLGGADHAIVAAASPSAFEQALDCLNPGGVVVLLALPAHDVLRLRIGTVIRKGLSILGSIGGSRADLVDVFRLHAKGSTQVLHQARVLDQVNTAIADIEADAVPAKLVLELR